MIEKADIETREFKSRDFEDIIFDLTKELELKNYKITKISNIGKIKERTGMKKDLTVTFQYYKIVEFCNLFTCSEIIMSDFRAGAFMPQRFAVYQPLNKESIFVSFLKPTSIARLFDSERMMKTSLTVEKDMDDVLSALKD